MSWNEIASFGATVRTLSSVRPPAGNAYSGFRAPLSQTLELLSRELGQLGARQVVIELDVREQDIRIDGFPRANARSPEHPGVVLSFDSRDFGPLQYATAEYTDWRDNLRAIALSLQALRAVDRYGVSKRGEQYQGWRAIPKSTDAADSIQNRQQAIEFLSRWGGDVKAALKATHPDKPGGNADEFRKVIRAKELTS